MMRLRQLVLPLSLASAACATSPFDHLLGTDENETATAPGSRTRVTKPAPSTTAGASGSSAVGATFTPAFAPSAPQLVDNGGAVLTSPEIVTITWQGDPNAARYETLGDAIGKTQYWHAMTSEYGVGPASGGKHVRMAAPMSAADRSDVGAFVAAQAGNPASGWPPPTSQTIYVLYPPPSSTIFLDGVDACSVEGGHHNDTIASGVDVAYAVVLQCLSDDGTLDTDFVTSIASHEMGEAALDPFQNGLAWDHVDEDHIAYDLMLAFQDESADLCEFFPEASFPSPELGAVTVQRQWSNASAKAGHNPCVPAPDEPYFNVTPLQQDEIEVDLTNLVSQLADADVTDTSLSGAHTTKGLRLDANGRAKVELGLFSDAPTDAWTLDVFEMDPFAPLDGNGGVFEAAATPTVAASLDRTSGKNGDKIVLSVQRLVDPPAGVSLVVVRSTLGQTAHFYPILATGT